MRLPLSILLILFSSAVLLVQAKPIVLEESESIIAIEDNLQILPDSEGQWDLEQVRLKTFQSFDPEAKLSKAYVYWAKFEVQNPRDEAVRWVLSPDWRKGTLRNSLVEVYVLTESGNPRILHTGKYLPLSQKDGIAKVYPHNQVEIALDALEKKEIYIRVEPIEQRRPVFVVRLMTYDYWLDQAPILRNILQAIFHAIMWFMFFSSLLNYFSQKSNAYLYYALFLASASFYFLSVSGMLMEIFLQENPKANSFVWVFASNLIGIGYFQFARSFLNTKRLMPLYDKIGRWIIIGALILIGVELIILQLTFNFDFLEKLNRGVLFAEVTFLLIVSLLYARHSKGVSRIFFWGTLCIVASGYLGLILNQMGLFHASLPAVEFLFVVQTLNFSWGLGYRQYQMQEERIEKRAEAANLRTLNEMKSRFFANISHEFRTPLTLLLGESESLQSEGESYTPTKRGEKLGVIRRMGQNLLELVNQILDLSKLDARSYEADWQYGDIISFVKGQSDAFESFAVSQQLDYRFESERDALHMDFDPKAVQTILSNLLSNAIKFTPKEGEVKLLLRVEDGPQMEEVLVLEVVDTGYGIPQADLTHLFDRYFQSSQNRSNAAGTGIGLSLVKALVQMMGGEISVQSELEQGTSFLVRLPVNHLHQSTTVAEPFAMPDPVIETPRVETQQSLSRSDFEKNLVLIVED
ncbi:MAG: sensor histidine kinase, partial [Bacteroidota bacterium]